ncbi:50S ribosomal protein L25/general stress protein Ctc [Phormidium sp. CLA17]|uniref:50S ribosomal protein L25/general stress protein Ctc n=1 Tax=Leptolyngbya sp. Cla-17 TaxID=2803751 RepID=UPI001492F227|nr:50S ribosomal protein L25/general stress protein Ctc [Leptolyngbya sp. Cla-17]MBM0741610.1 50S ribosomal protein L25/general stress protein Ctc [Leptolyngbya sp. Cla-17]
MKLAIECQPRPDGSKPNALRRSGKLPAVLYGHKGTESISLVLSAKEAERLMREASINNTLIDITVPEVPWAGKALLREVQTHPWRGTPYHVSFYAVADHGDLEVNVPLHFVGTATGVKVSGGSLETAMGSLEVRCAASIIPENIEVDVSNLEVGDTIHISQLVLPAGVAALGDPERVVASVVAGREE